MPSFDIGDNLCLQVWFFLIKFLKAMVMVKPVRSRERAHKVCPSVGRLGREQRHKGLHDLCHMP